MVLLDSPAGVPLDGTQPDSAPAAISPPRRWTSQPQLESQEPLYRNPKLDEYKLDEYARLTSFGSYIGMRQRGAHVYI